MLFIIFFVCLSTNFLLVRSKDIDNVTVTLTYDTDCKILHPAYTFTEGQNVTLLIQWSEIPVTVVYSTWHLGNIRFDKNITETYTQTLTANKSIEGDWTFYFVFLENKFEQFKDTETTFNHNVRHIVISGCTTKVTIEPPGSSTKKLLQKLVPRNSNIEHLEEEVNTTKDQNMDVKATINFLTEQHKKMSRRLTFLERKHTAYKKRINILENKFGVFKRNYNSCEIHFHNTSNTAQDNKPTVKYITDDVEERLLQQICETPVNKDTYKNITKSTEVFRNLLMKIQSNQ